MSVSVSLTFRWAMGHRILGLDGAGAKCANIHGHNWAAEITWPNDDGTLEFGAVKDTVGSWIDHALDHGFAVDVDDPFLDYLHTNRLKYHATDGPPTTEKIADLLASAATSLVRAVPTRVHLIEGYRNAATWTLA